MKINILNNCLIQTKSHLMYNVFYIISSAKMLAMNKTMMYDLNVNQLKDAAKEICANKDDFDKKEVYSIW